MSDEIRAGGAYVELSIRDRIAEGMAGAKARMDAFSRAVRATGGEAARHIATAVPMIAAAAGTAAITGIKTAARVTAATIDAGKAVSQFASRLGHFAMAGRVVSAGISAPLRMGSWLTGGIGKALMSYKGSRLFGGLDGLYSKALGGAFRVGSGAMGAMAKPFQWLGKLSAEQYYNSWKLWAMAKMSRGIPVTVQGGAGLAGLMPGAGAMAPTSASQLARAATAPGRAIAAAPQIVGTAVAPIHRVAGAAAAAGAHLKSMGMQLATAGASMAIVAAPFALLIARFQSVSKSTATMAERTNTSVEDMSALRFAAQNAGMGMEELETHVKQLGAGGAAKRFGADMATLRQQAADAGALINAKQAGIGQMVGRAWKAVAGSAIASFDAVAVQLGTAFGPSLKDAADNVMVLFGGIRAVSQIVTDWIGSNQNMVSGITTAALAVGSLAAVLIGTGSGLAMLGMALSSIGTALGVVFSPMALIVGAVAAASIYFIRFTETGAAAAQALFGAFAPAGAAVQDTIQGIKDALTSGDFAAAAAIAGHGAKLAIMEGIAGLETILPESWAGTLGMIKDLTADLLQGNWSSVIADMQGMWASFCGGIVGLMTMAASAAINVWKAEVMQLANWMVQLASQGGIWGKIFSKIVGADMSKVSGQRSQLNEELRAKNIGNTTWAIGEMEQKLTTARAAGDKDQIAELERGLVSLKSDLAKWQTGPGDMQTTTQDANDSITRQADQWQQQSDNYLQSVNAAAQARKTGGMADATERAAASRPAGSASFEDAVLSERAALDKLRAEQAAKADKVRKQVEEPQKWDQRAGSQRNAPTPFGTFSAAEAMASFGGGGQTSLAVQQLAEQREIRKAAMRQATALDVFANKRRLLWSD